MREALSLSELNAFDPRAPHGARERRFLCPYCGTDKPRDAGHRSLAVNTESGAWTCHRCHANGKLSEWWTERTEKSHKERQAANIKRLFSLTPRNTQPQPLQTADNRVALEAAYQEYLSSFNNSPAMNYLLSRGIPADIAIMSGCGYQADGRFRLLGNDKRVIFPVYDREGNLVALSSRAIEQKPNSLKALTCGRKKLGVFATCGALECEIPIITEAPIDALSFAAAGFPAIAIVGSDGWPEWLTHHCAFRTVLIATDADMAGDTAFGKMTSVFKLRGAVCLRLRPDGKDWNDVLVSGGIENIQAAVSALVRDVEKPTSSMSDSELGISQSDEVKFEDPVLDQEIAGDVWEEDGPVVFCALCGYRLLFRRSRLSHYCLSCRIHASRAQFANVSNIQEG